MNDLFLSLSSLAVGVVVTVLVSRYYFRRTVEKSLTPYIQSSSLLFSGVNPEVRRHLKILYKDIEVEHLQEIQLLISNSGERALRDIISPLTLKFPDKSILVDAALLHIFPKERTVDLYVEENSIQFIFPLLNRGEFFIARLLVQVAQGEISTSALKFHITADDLPPVLNATWLPYELIKGDDKRDFEVSLFLGSIVFGIAGASVAFLAYNTWNSLVFGREGFFSFLPEVSIIMIATLLAFIPTFLLILVSGMMLGGAFGDFSFPPKKRFIIPKDLRGRRRPFIELEEDYEVPKPKSD